MTFLKEKVKMTKKVIPVAQYDGKSLVAKYASISVASTMNGVQNAHIGKVANGLRNTAGGFVWKSLNNFNGTLSPRCVGIVQTDRDGNILAAYADLATAANLTGISESKISAVLLGTRRSVNGYIFS